jgi:DNA-binding winged helix-turn-helix (wHTH) protein
MLFLMEYRGEVLSFGQEPFRLEIRSHPESAASPHRTLSRAGRKVKAEKRSLELLELFLRQPHHDWHEPDIEQRLWQSDQVGNVEHHIYRLRKALGDDPKAPRFIETIPGYGYRFMVDVKPEGLSGRDGAPNAAYTKIIEQWDEKRFLDFLNETTRGEESDEEGDLRILTTAFTRGIPDSLPDLLENNVRIKVLVTSEALIRARNKLRPDNKPPKALRTLRDQLHTLDTMKKRSTGGMLDVLETDVMPCGFVAHSRHGALLGLFLATESYGRGPMIEVGPGTKLWEILRADWKEIWKDAARRARTKKAPVS